MLTIKKISFDNIYYIGINAKLDKDNRVLYLNLNDEEFKKVFNCYYEELKDNFHILNKYKKCYIIDENDVFYSCFGCIWGFSRQDFFSNIKIYTAPIDIILENKITNEKLDDIKVTGIALKTSYPLYTDFKFHIANFNMNYDKEKRIFVSKTKGDDKYYINLSIKSKKLFKFKTLSKIIYSVLEMFFLILGDIPQLEMITLCDDDSEFILYRELVDKYHQRKRLNPKNEIIGDITPTTINSKTIREFIQFRNNTNIIFDMLMIDMNSNGYLEIKNSSLLQLLEGLSKTIGPIKDENFRKILAFYFKSNKSTNFILSRRDKKETNVGNSADTDYVFIIKGTGHRNYLSHLDVNTRREVFVKIENNYAYWKLSLCARLYILDYLGIIIDKKLVKQLLHSIDKWAIDKHFRYKV